MFIALIRVGFCQKLLNQIFCFVYPINRPSFQRFPIRFAVVSVMIVYFNVAYICAQIFGQMLKQERAHNCCSIETGILLMNIQLVPII